MAGSEREKQFKERMMPENEPNYAVHESQISQLRKETDDQWTAIGDIRKFMQKLVPVWTTVVLMAMSAITGSALTFAGMIIKFANSK